MKNRPVLRMFRLAAAGLALAMLAAACDGDDGPTPAASGSDNTLASFMGWEDEETDDASREAEWRDQDAKYQEALRACMAEAGFEYIPVDHSQGVVAVDDWDEEEYIRTQGFGITTWYGNEEEFVDSPDDEFEDPNWAITEAMSDSEREAYYEALYGTEEEQREGAVIEYDDETGEEIGWFTSGPGPGCEGQASEAAWGSQADTQELWEELQPAFEQLQARVEADPRIVEWTEDWARCMADAGHDYESPTAMHDRVYDEFQTRLEEILGPDGGYADPFEGWSEAEIDAFFQEKTEDEIDAFFREADAGRLDNVDQDALTALQQEEIDLALQDLECRGGDGFWEIYQEVSAEYEGDLIAENRELLEKIREAEGG